jgi:hypothetical protein
MRDGRIPGVDLDRLRRDGQRIFDKLRAAYTERDYRRGAGGPLFPPVFPPGMNEDVIANSGSFIDHSCV